jgi:hypothetical protein
LLDRIGGWLLGVLMRVLLSISRRSFVDVSRPYPRNSAGTDRRSSTYDMTQNGKPVDAAHLNRCCGSRLGRLPWKPAHRWPDGTEVPSDKSLCGGGPRVQGRHCGINGKVMTVVPLSRVPGEEAAMTHLRPRKGVTKPA